MGKTITVRTPAKKKILRLNKEVVAISDLGVDNLHYHRDEIIRRIMAMSGEAFDVVQFGYPIVSRRRDGSLWIVNGLQRIMAAANSGYTHIEVVIFDGDVASEAGAFVSANRNLEKVKGNLKFRGEWENKRPHARWAEELFNNRGWSGMPTAQPAIKVRALKMMEDYHGRYGEEQATVMFNWAADVLAVYDRAYPVRAYLRENIGRGLMVTAAWSPTTDPAMLSELLRRCDVTPRQLSEMSNAASDVRHDSPGSRYAHNLRQFFNVLASRSIFL